MSSEIKESKVMTLKEREIYNQAVKDTLQEVWLYDGIIPDEEGRKNLCKAVQAKLSYKSPEPKNSANLSLIAYETDLLKLLNLAVLEFFNPRRASDAKKDEVTQWLKDKGANLNIVVSDNVADSIFTIIKPKNHNPKIKRVQSIDWMLTRVS